MPSLRHHQRSAASGSVRSTGWPRAGGAQSTLHALQHFDAAAAAQQRFEFRCLMQPLLATKKRTAARALWCTRALAASVKPRERCSHASASTPAFANRALKSGAAARTRSPSSIGKGCGHEQRCQRGLRWAAVAAALEARTSSRESERGWQGQTIEAQRARWREPRCHLAARALTECP